MTVPVETARHEYVATAGQTVFPYPGPVRDTSEVWVYRNGLRLTYPTHYTLTGVGSPGGNVVLTSAATADEQYIVERVVPYTQLTDYAEGGAFPAAAQEWGLDHLTRQTQQLQAALHRCLQLSRAEAFGIAGLTLPRSSTVGLPAYLRWNAAGTLIETSPYLPPPYTPPEGAVPLGGINVKTAGCVGDGVNDDSVVLQALIDALPASGGLLYFPEGTYRLTQALECTDTPLRLEGEGTDIVQIRQDAPGEDGLIFTSTLLNNNLVGVAGSARKVQLTVRNLTWLRAAGTSGGTAIRGSWDPHTENAPYLTIDHVKIRGEIYGVDGWAKGIHGSNVNGSRLHDVTIWGDADATADTGDPVPYVLEDGILFDGDDVAGKINHYWSGLSISFCNTAIRIVGWYEGFYVSQFELVHVGTGIWLAGPTGPLHGGNFLATNIHMDFREYGVVASRWHSVWLSNADIYKAGGLAGTGFVGNGIVLVTCPYFRFTGGMLHNIHTATSNGLVADLDSHWGTVDNVMVTGWNNSGLVLEGNYWNIGLNSFDLCDTGIFITGDANQVGVQKFGTLTAHLTFTGVGNSYQAVSLVATQSVTLAGGAATEEANLPLPSGIFGAKPAVGLLSVGNDQNLTVAYLHSSGSSTASNARVKFRTIDGTNIVAGAYRVNYAFS